MEELNIKLREKVVKLEGENAKVKQELENKLGETIDQHISELAVTAETTEDKSMDCAADIVHEIFEDVVKNSNKENQVLDDEEEENIEGEDAQYLSHASGTRTSYVID